MRRFSFPRTLFRRPAAAPEVHTFRALGDDARDRCEWVEAAANYRIHLKLHPDDFAIWVQLGHALKESSQIARALVAYSEALRLNEKDADLHLNLGHLFKLIRLYDSAELHYNESKNIDGNSNAASELDHLLTLQRQTTIFNDESADTEHGVFVSSLAQTPALPEIPPEATPLSYDKDVKFDLTVYEFEEYASLLNCLNDEPLIAKTSNIRILIDSSHSPLNIHLVSAIMDGIESSCEIWCHFAGTLKAWMKPDMLIEYMPKNESHLYYLSVDVLVITSPEILTEDKISTAIASGAIVFSSTEETQLKLGQIFDHLNAPIPIYCKIRDLLVNLASDEEKIAVFRRESRKSAIEFVASRSLELRQ